MVKTGYLDSSIAALSLVNWKNKKEIESSEPFKEYSAGLDKTLKVLKEVGKSGNIDRIIGVESTLVTIEQELHQNIDPSVLPSLNAARTDFSVIDKSLQAVRSDKYNQVDNAYHVKRKAHGVPVDGFHEAANSHITRLGNRMRSVGISIPEKNIVRQRQANMRIAKELYITLQSRALGVDSPSQSIAKGLGR